MRIKKLIRCASIIIFGTAAFSCDILDPSVQPDRAAHNDLQNKPIGSRENDATFVLETADELVLEIQLSQLALKNSSTAEVKQLAIQVMTDNNVAMSELREITFRNNLSSRQLGSDQHKKQLKFFLRKNGVEFNKAFSAYIVKHNRELLKNFEDIAIDGTNEELRIWATGKIIGLKRQLAMAESVGQKRIGSHSEGDSKSLIE